MVFGYPGVAAAISTQAFAKWQVYVKLIPSFSLLSANESFTDSFQASLSKALVSQ